MKSNQLYLLFTVLTLAGAGWVGLHLFQPELHNHNIGACIFKLVTGIPCPACGTTRSVVHLVHGDIQQAAWINPFGFFAVLFLVIIPCWLLHDLILKRRSLFHTYVRAEAVIKTKSWMYLPMIALVLINWFWNITKNN